MLPVEFAAPPKARGVNVKKGRSCPSERTAGSFDSRLDGDEGLGLRMKS